MKQLFRKTFDQVCLSEEKAQEIRTRLSSWEQGQPAGRKRRWTARTVLAAVLAAAVCCLGMGAARLVLRQAQIQFFATEEEIPHDGRPGSVGHYGGADYSQLQSVSQWVSLEWEGNDGETLAEEQKGRVEDGWTAMRTYQGRENGAEYDRAVYLGDKLSDFSACWQGNGWDVSWLEERYAPVAGAQLYMTLDQTSPAACRQVTAIGEYRGEEGQIFNLQYGYNSSFSWGDQYMLSEGDEIAQLYQTKDGVTVSIEIARSNTGKPVFWVALYSNHVHFSMFGTQLELEEIQDIVDSLKLSLLCAYEVKS